MESPSFPAAASVDLGPVDLCEAARLARECPMVGHAVDLARWVGGEGRPVTAGRVLRRADVAAAGAVLGVPVPSQPRTAADVPVLHRPWTFAVGAGLIDLGKSAATAGSLLEGWPTLGDAGVLDAWLGGLRAVCAAESEARAPESVGGLVLAFLEAVSEVGRPDIDALWQRVTGALLERALDGDRFPFGVSDVAGKYLDLQTRDPFAGLVTLLGRMGAVTGRDTAHVAITELGRWALARMLRDLPPMVRENMSALEVAGALADCVHHGADPWMAVRRWLEPRPPTEAALELLTAAADLSAAARIAAADVADGLGDMAVPAWRAVAHLPALAVHARVSLALAEDPQATPTPAEVQWLVVESATAALDGPGPDEALTVVFDGLPGDTVEARVAAIAGTGHPDAVRVTEALRAFIASGASRSIEQVYQIKVGLMRCRPPIWRRVQVPATITLGDLHMVIQTLFGWDGDHLHMFEVGSRRYSSSLFDLSHLDMDDEDALRVRDALTETNGKIRYEYDFGASWWHEITLEKVLDQEPGAVYPRCTAFASDSPVEYWSEEDPRDSDPFDLAETNRRLARLAGVVNEDQDRAERG